MKSAKRITAFILVMVMLMCSSVFAAAPAIVSPTANSVNAGDSLLISVKLTEKQSIKVSVFEEKETNAQGQQLPVATAAITSADLAKLSTEYVSGVAITKSTSTQAAIDGTVVTVVNKSYSETVCMEPVSYTNTADMGMFTKLLTVTPGLYRVLVQTLDASGNVVESSYSYSAVKEKPVETQTNIFETAQNGAVQFLQNVLKSIFK